MPQLSTSQPAARSTRTIITKMVLQMLTFWGLYFVAWPGLLWRVEIWLDWQGWQFGSPSGRVIGLILFVIGGGLALWGSFALARRGAGLPLLTSGRPMFLVVLGPYRHIRHPMAVAGVLQGVASGIFLGSPLALFSGIVGGAVWYFIKRPREEQTLEEQFGDDYRAYRNTVPGFIPRWRSGRHVKSGSDKSS
ncbi:MAG: isoprenylcysteine carboxylmethyltransferase family protein [Planctomycetota bacterium]|nr:isoprenylcysteine carboxylmethyltransferase family protein [Planctomycetota bacterium]